jgi:hypothetical protein
MQGGERARGEGARVRGERARGEGAKREDHAWRGWKGEHAWREQAKEDASARGERAGEERARIGIGKRGGGEDASMSVEGLQG